MQSLRLALVILPFVERVVDRRVLPFFIGSSRSLRLWSRSIVDPASRDDGQLAATSSSPPLPVVTRSTTVASSARGDTHEVAAWGGLMSTKNSILSPSA